MEAVVSIPNQYLAQIPPPSPEDLRALAELSPSGTTVSKKCAANLLPHNCLQQMHFAISICSDVCLWQSFSAACVTGTAGHHEDERSLWQPCIACSACTCAICIFQVLTACVWCSARLASKILLTSALDDVHIALTPLQPWRTL